MTNLWITIIVPIILWIPAFSEQQLDCGIGGEAVEGSEHTLTCVGLQAGDTVYWTKRDQHSVTIAVANCTGSGSCQNTYPGKYDVTRASSASTSRLKILQVTRDLSYIGGDWTCTALSSSTCFITVIFPPDHDGCEVRFDGASGKVLGQCVLHKVFPSPTCTWSEQFQGGQWVQIPNNQTTLTETQFVDASNSRIYFRATCQLHRPLPVTLGSYNYKVQVIPGHVEPVVNFTSTNTIRLPASPSLTSICPSHYVKDASIAKCPCMTSDLGSPPAQLAWIDPDGRSVVSASTLTLTLPFTDVTTGYNGGTYHCEVQHHTGNSRVQYVPNIAVRPNKPTVSGPKNQTSFSPGQTITLQCTADGGRPDITGLVLQCPGQPNAPGRQEGGVMISRQTLALAVSNDGTFCTCIADNGYVTSDTAVFVLRVPGNGGGALSETTIIIIAVVVCVVVLCVFVAAVVVCLRKRGSYSKMPPDPSGSSNRNGEVHRGADVSNPVYNVTVGQQSSGNHSKSPAQLETEDEEETEYENTKKTSPKKKKGTYTATGKAVKQGNKKGKTGQKFRETRKEDQDSLYKDTNEETIKTKTAETQKKSDRRSPLSPGRRTDRDKGEQSECSSGMSDEEEHNYDNTIPQLTPDVSGMASPAQDFGKRAGDERRATNRDVKTGRRTERHKGEQSESSSVMSEEKEHDHYDTIPQLPTDVSGMASSAQEYKSRERDERHALNTDVKTAWQDSKPAEPSTACPKQPQTRVQELSLDSLATYSPSTRSVQDVQDIAKTKQHSEQDDDKTERPRKSGKHTQGKKGGRPMVYPPNHPASVQEPFNPSAVDSVGDMTMEVRQRPKSQHHEALTNSGSRRNESDQSSTSHPKSPRRLPTPRSSCQQGSSSESEVRQYLNNIFKPGGESEYPRAEVSTVHGSTGRGGRRSSDVTVGVHTISGDGFRTEDDMGCNDRKITPQRSRSLSDINEHSQWKVSKSFNV